MERLAEEAEHEAEATYASTRNTLLALVSFALLLGLSIAFLLARGLTAAVGQVAAAAQQIAREDLPSFVRVAKALAAGDLTQDAVVTAQRIDGHQYGRARRRWPATSTS